MQLAERLSDLLRPEAFPHPARDIRLIDTHISWVVLAGDFAYKLRKPVNFGFLDFSTLEQRRIDCRAEVTLNRRLCPDLYLDVVDVVQHEDGRLEMGGFGTPVEPAVKMHRLPESGMLPSLLQRGEGDGRLMRRLARQLADFHAGAATGEGVDEYGSVDVLRTNWEENFAQTAVLDPSQRDVIEAYVTRFIANNTGLLEGRLASGRIRDGHGDLHAASVCVTRRRLYLFDCIEFNARFRCADVAAEVAFLAMDLEHFGRADLAAMFVESYIRASNDPELRLLLDFYKCYRAFVRGKVLGFRLLEPQADAESTERIRNEARAYFDLACAYANPLARPVLLVTMGLPASGKTTLAHGLASRLGLVHLSSDVTRKQLAGLRATFHATDAFESGIYSRGMSRRTYAVLRRKAARWLRRGQSVVLDATYGQPSERAALRQLARRIGVRLYVIRCQAQDAVLQARLTTRTKDQLSVSDVRPELWSALRLAFVEPTDTLVTFNADTTRPAEALIDEIVSDMYADQAGVAGARAA
jgi:aminoglycoside phosphotransferase family enzyme/predicted kinase